MADKVSVVAIAIAAVALVVSIVRTSHEDVTVQKVETAYERVVRTKTLRCGYEQFPPFISMDPSSKALQGMNFDYVNAVGKSLGLTVAWTETLAGQEVVTLQSGKVDAICGAEGPFLAANTAYLHYSAPMIYLPYYMWVRANDTRFDGDIGKANNPGITAAFIGGDVTQDFIDHMFPYAKRDSIGQSSDYSLVYMDVITSKADFVVNDTFTASNFNAHNTQKIRRVGTPLAVIPNQIAVLRDEEALGDMLSQAIMNIRLRGEENAILTPYERDYPDSFYRAKKTFE